MKHSEFYGVQESEQYKFYRIPKLLFTAEKFKDISLEAKFLYGLLLERMTLSQKNGWIDEEGRVYIIYKIEEIMQSRRILQRFAMCGNICLLPFTMPH